MTLLVTHSPSPTTPVSLVTSANPPSGPITHAQLAAMYTSAAHLDTSSLFPLPPRAGDQPSLYPPPISGLDLKDANLPASLPPGWPYTSMYCGYDPALAPYPLAGYGMAFDAARRKNATREATSTLKAWLNEHKKNPYPTKGEKIMLAIITKMTLTQVSTWFANARRRLKKENKVTWEPRSKNDEDDDDDDDDKLDDKSATNDDEYKKDDSETIYGDHEKEKCEEINNRLGLPRRDELHSSATPTDVHPKPRIWSLADMATSGSLNNNGTASLASAVGGKIMNGALTRGLHHLERSPYTRPLFGPSPYSYLPPGVSESLLSYSYGNPFGGFSPITLGDVAPGLLASPFIQELNRHDLIKPEVIRPERRIYQDRDT